MTQREAADAEETGDVGQVWIKRIEFKYRHSQYEMLPWKVVADYVRETGDDDRVESTVTVWYLVAKGRICDVTFHGDASDGEQVQRHVIETVSMYLSRIGFPADLPDGRIDADAGPVVRKFGELRW